MLHRGLEDGGCVVLPALAAGHQGTQLLTAVLDALPAGGGGEGGTISPAPSPRTDLPPGSA